MVYVYVAITADSYLMEQQCNKMLVSYVKFVYLLHDSILDKTMEGWVGRKKDDSTEIAKKSISSHVARMTGGRFIF